VWHIAPSSRIPCRLHLGALYDPRGERVRAREEACCFLSLRERVGGEGTSTTESAGPLRCRDALNSAATHSNPQRLISAYSVEKLDFCRRWKNCSRYRARSSVQAEGYDEELLSRCEASNWLTKRHVDGIFDCIHIERELGVLTISSFSTELGQKQTLPIRHVLAETANTKGATRVTPFAVCFGAPVG
jgi:hypothetical protein